MEGIKDKLVKYCDWLIGAFLILFVFWSPISITGAEVAVSFAFLFWLVRMLAMRKVSFLRNPLYLPIVVFLIVGAVAVITASDQSLSLKGYRSVWWIFVFFLTVNNVKNESQFKRLIQILISITTIAAAYGIFQHLTKIDFFGNVKHLRLHLARSTGFFDGPATFANYILLVLPVVIGLSFYIRTRRKKLWLLLSSSIILVAIIFSYGRGAWLGLIAGLTFMGVLSSRRLFPFVVAGIIICSMFILILPSSEFAQRVFGTLRSQRPVGDRIELWEGSLRIIGDHPFTGVGWKGFRIVYPRYNPTVGDQPPCYAHNNFVDLSVETGLLGFGIFLWLLLAIYRVGFRIFKRLEDGYFKGIAWGFLGSFTAFLIAGLSQYNFGDSEVVMLFYFLLGMVMVIPRIVETKSVD